MHDYGTDQEEDVQPGDARGVRRQVDDVEMNAWKYAGEMARVTFASSLLHDFWPSYRSPMSVSFPEREAITR